MSEIIPFMQPKRVLQRTFNNIEYKIRLARPITEIDDFEEEIMALEEANPNDMVFVQISSPGGSLETCDFLCRRMEECQAPIVVEIGLTCASAASALMLQADDWVINDSSTVMIHACSYSPGWGKEVDVLSSVTYTNRINREWVERTYRGFLTESELIEVIDNGKDLYFYAEDLRERLPKYKEYRDTLNASKPCRCGDPLCGQNTELEGEDQGFEDMPTLESIIEAAVQAGVTKALAARDAKEKKASKAKTPSVKTQKALNEAKEIVEKSE